MERNPPGRDDDERTLRPVDAAGQGHGGDSERAFWRQFAEATTPKAFCQSWLPLQCRLLKGVRCAMVLLGNPDLGPFTPVAVWPDAKLSMDHLTGAAEQALKERRGLLLEGQSTADPETLLPETYHVAYPIEVSGKIHGVVVLEVEQHPRHEVQAIMRQLHWGAAWLEVLVRRTDALQSEEANERLGSAQETLKSRQVERAGIEEKLGTAQTLIASLGSRRAETQARLDELSARQATQSERLDASKATIQEADEEVALVEEEQRLADATLKKAEKTLQDAEANLEKRQSEVVRLEEEKRQKSEDLAAL